MAHNKAYYIALKLHWQKFTDLTKNFDLEDWRTVRTPFYWESDKMEPLLAVQHKIELIEYYIKKGLPLN